MYPAEQERGRRANLLGALTLRAADEVAAAVHAATGLGPADSTALSVLTTSLTGASLGSLADALALTQPGATRVVDRLAGRGLLRREPGPDRRTSALRPTAEGERVAAVVLEARAEALARLLSPLSEPDAERLTGLLEQLLGPLATSTADAVRGCRLCDPVGCGHHDGRCPVTLGLDARGRGVAGPV